MHLISHHMFVSAVEAERREHTFEWKGDGQKAAVESVRRVEMEVVSPDSKLSGAQVKSRMRVPRG